MLAYSHQGSCSSKGVLQPALEGKPGQIVYYNSRLIPCTEADTQPFLHTQVDVPHKVTGVEAKELLNVRDDAEKLAKKFCPVNRKEYTTSHSKNPPFPLHD